MIFCKKIQIFALIFAKFVCYKGVKLKEKYRNIVSNYFYRKNYQIINEILTRFHDTLQIIQIFALKFLQRLPATK